MIQCTTYEHRVKGATGRLRVNQRHRASRPAWKNLLRYRTPTMAIAGMRQVVAAIDDRPRHSGGGYTLGKQTPRPAAVASEMGHKRPTRPLFEERRLR